MRTSLIRASYLEKNYQVRKERGWSQEQLALESGLARSYLGGVERGQRNIALLNICRLAETLNVPASRLMDFYN